MCIATRIATRIAFPRLLPIMVAGMLLAGCARDVYEIEIQPQGDAFHRTLTAWHEDAGDRPKVSPLPEREIERLEKLYQQHTTVDDGKKHVFSGRFQGATPADVGGAGSYEHWSSALGTLSNYVERFGGDDDLVSELNRRRRRADQLVNLVIGWAESEWSDHPGFGGLRRFLDDQFRRDLKNIGVYAWTADAVSDYQDDAGRGFLVRVGQYLAERDYLAMTDLPALVRALDDDFAPVANLAQRVIARELGVEQGESIPESLAWLGNPDRLKASFDKHVRTTDLYKNRVAEWREEHSDNPGAEPPEPSDVAGSLLAEATVRFDVAADDLVRVQVATDVKPFFTNGEWDASSGKVKWSEHLGKHPALPALVYAAWTRPDQEAQSKHFGRTILRGEQLAQYVLWHASLTEEQAGRWDEFVGGLEPDDNLAKAIRTFRFPGDPPADPDLPPKEQPPSLADTPRRLILKALEGEDP